MKPVIVLAYDGGADADRAIALLTSRHDADIVTMTVDIGQTSDVRATRDAALAAGAVRAHVFDAIDDYVRECVLPALQSAPAAGSVLASQVTLAFPVIAARLVDVAHLEGARVVAHSGGDDLSARIHALDASLQVLTLDPAHIAGAGPLRPTGIAARHLLQRPVADPAAARGVVANIVIEFDEAVPVAINGVALTLTELVESLSVIGGGHGIGYAQSTTAPGALVLDAAYRALDRRSGVVRIELLDGQQRVLPIDDRTTELVHHA